MHFCQIRRVNLARLGLAAELGRMSADQMRTDRAVPVQIGGLNTPEPRTLFSVLVSLSWLPSVGLHGLLFAGAWLRVAGLAGLV